MDKTLGKEMVATWNYNREYEGIEISFDDKPSEEIRTKMKGAGFRWSSRQMKWYAKDTAQSRKVASEIATQGEDVGESLTFEQKMQRDKERTEQRQERLGAKAEKLEKKSESLLDQAHKMADVIPFGQPILVGHHSEGRDRRYRDKIHNKFGKGFELQDEAKVVERRLEGSQALARKRETPGYMSRKIDKLEADLRKFEREKEGWKNQIPEWEKRTGKLKEEIAYWKKELGEVGGLMVTSADVRVGDEVFYSGTGRWYEVIRVNPKSVTIKNWHDVPKATWIAEYSKVKGVRRKSESPGKWEITKTGSGEPQITNELPIALKIIKDRFDNWYSHGDTLDSQYAPDMLGQAVASTSYGKDLKRLLDDLNKMGYKDLREWYLSVNPRAIGVVEKKPIYPEPEKSTTPKVHTYFFRNRPPDIGTYPEGAVMKEAWLPMKKTPKGGMAFGWVSYERELTADEIKNYELFVDLPAMPKLVAEFVKYVHDEGILEGHKEFKSEYGRAYIAWAKANNDWDASKGDEAEFLRHLARLAGVTEPKPKIPDAEFEKAKLFLSALPTARTLDELLGWQPAVKRWSIKFPDLEKELENEYQARFDYLKAVKDVSEARRKEKASKPQSGQAKDLYKQMRKTNSVRELDGWRNRVLFEAHLPDVEEDILLRELAAKWRVYLETRGIPALEKLDKLPLDYKNEDYYFGTEVWIHPTTTIFDDRPQKGILHSARNEGELFDVMLEGVPGTTRVQIDRIYVTKLVEKPELRYQAPVKKTYRYASFNRPLWNGFDPGVPYNIVEIQKSDYLNDRKPHNVIETHTPILLEHIKNLELIDYAEVEEKNKLYSYAKTVFSAGPHLNQINDLIRSKKITTTEKIDEYKTKLDKQKSEREKEEPKIPKTDTTSKDYKSGYNTAIQGLLYPPVPAWTDQGKAEFDAGYTEGKRVLYEQPKPDEQLFGKSIEVPHGKPKNLTCYKCGEKFQRIIDTEQKTITCPKCHEQIEIKKSEELDKDLEAGQKLTLMNREKRAELKEVLVFGQPEDTKKFVAEFGKPIEVLPEKPKVLGAPSKQELSLKEARVKAAEGKRLKGQQTLFSAVSTSTRLTQFEEKPPRAEPLKFKRPIPVVGRMRTPPYPFIRPKPKLLFAMSEEQSDIDEERQAFELARKMKAKFLEEKLKKQIKAEQGQ